MSQAKPIPSSSAFIANRVFIAGLFILFLNDHLFKWQYHNWLTGKLSDVAGLMIFPLFLSFLFPGMRRFMAMATGLLFVLWKLPLSASFIAFYNTIAPIKTSRVVDYTDLLALAVLPMSHYIVYNVERYAIGRLSFRYLSWVIALPACLVFIATSPPVSHYMQPGGDIHIGKSYKLKVSRKEALAKIESYGFKVKRDTTGTTTKAANYIIDNAVLNGGKDTIQSIQFGFLQQGNNDLLLINNIKLKSNAQLSDPATLKRYKKLYQQMIKEDIVESLKK